MKKWAVDTVNAHIVPGDAAILAHTTLWIGNRINLTKGYPIRVFSRDPTPLADAIVQFHVERMFHVKHDGA